MDYRELLIKYIGHIISAEGISFLRDGYMGNDFTDEEKAALVECDKAAWKER